MSSSLRQVSLICLWCSWISPQVEWADSCSVNAPILGVSWTREATLTVRLRAAPAFWPERASGGQGVIKWKVLRNSSTSQIHLLWADSRSTAGARRATGCIYKVCVSVSHQLQEMWQPNLLILALFSIKHSPDSNCHRLLAADTSVI